MRIRSVLASEDRQRRVAVARSYVSQDLIIGAIFANDHEYVFDQRRIANLLRDRNRLGIWSASGSGADILRQIPVIVLENLSGHRRQSSAIGHRDDADSTVVLVSIVVRDVVIGLKRITRPDAFVVGNDEHVFLFVEDN